MVTLTHNQIIAIESIAIGAIGAGGQGAYQALSSHSGQPLQVGQIVAAFLLPALGYVLTALHWLSVPAPAAPSVVAVPPAT